MSVLIGLLHNQRGKVALAIALAIAVSVIAMSVIYPGGNPCDTIENEWLRWLLGCPPLDAAGGGGSGAGIIP